jgi:hypothetical protein
MYELESLSIMTEGPLGSLVSPAKWMRGTNVQKIGRVAGLSEQNSPEKPQPSIAVIFSRAHRTNAWRGSESRSGPGSSLAATHAIRQALPVIVRAYGVKTLLDAPCGDFNWIKDVDLSNTRYVGIDVVPELIRWLSQEHEQHDRIFQVANIVVDSLPSADLILCRDCLVHLNEADAESAIEQLKATGAELLLATTFYARSSNPVGSTGGWRPLNMQLPPFAFPRPELLIPEREFDPAVPHSDKALGLWRLQNVP